METIKPGQFVELTYDLFVGPENELMERATPEAPLRFVFGTEQMLPSFETKIKDLKVGDTFDLLFLATMLMGNVMKIMFWNLRKRCSRSMVNSMKNIFSPVIRCR